MNRFSSAHTERSENGECRVASPMFAFRGAKKIAIAMALGFFVVARAFAQIGPPLPAQGERSPLPPGWFVADAAAADFYVPVITFEQIYALSARRQGYRIQIFRDGRAIYHGTRNVKTLGEVYFDIKSEQVTKILEAFERFKFGKVPENLFGTPRSFAPLMLVFSVRQGDDFKTVRLSGYSLGGMLLKVLEDEVMSARWRCPHEDETGVDPCLVHDRFVERASSHFLNDDLPKLEDIYK